MKGNMGGSRKIMGIGVLAVGKRNDTACLRLLHRREALRQRGFTLVELLIVMIVSLIMLAGMVGLVDMAFGHLTSNRNLQSISDASRRGLSSMARQIKGALYFVNAECTSTNLCFYADIDSDNSTANVDVFTKAEKVVFSRSGTNLVQQTTQPVLSPPQPTEDDGLMSTVNIASYLLGSEDGLKFYYFTKGAKPNWNPATQTYDNAITGDVNGQAGMVKVRLTMKKGSIQRVYEQDVFLRILNRS